MKICVTAKGRGFDSEMDARFGRCENFIIVDSDSMECEVISNENKDGMGGVGIKSAQFIGDKDVKVVITGNVGPNAHRTLDTLGIEIYTGVFSSVKEAVDKYIAGALNKTSNPTVESHGGMS